MDSVSIALPFPPSINDAYAGKAKRYKSARYKDWIYEADFMLAQQKPLPHFDCEVKVTIDLGRPDNRRRDVANYEKLITDKLVNAGVLKDDCLIIENTQRWDADTVGVVVTVEAVQ